MQELLLKAYLNTENYIGDDQMSGRLRIGKESLRCMRARLIEKGHTFYYKTVYLDCGKMGNIYKYAGGTNKGLILMDDYQEGCDPDKLRQILKRMRSDSKGRQVLKAIISIHGKGYWSANDIMQLTGMSLRQFASAKNSLTKNFGFSFHSRGACGDRSYRVIECTGLRTEYKSKQQTKQTENKSLLNKVFA